LSVLNRILALSLAVKLLVVFQLYDHPLLQPDAGLDTTAYTSLAREVLQGNPALGPGLYFVSPLYIYFLAAILWITDSFLAVRIVQVALGTLAIALVWLTAREWFSDRTAWIAAILAGLTGLFTFYESLVLQAAIDTVLTAAALLALARGLKRGSGQAMAASGLIFGIAALNRPNMLLAAGGVALMLLAWRCWRPAVALTAGLLAGLAPVAIRNAVVSNQWSLVSSHGGLNFLIGNGEGATGFYRTLPGITPDISGQQRDARRVAAGALGRPVSDAEASDYFFQVAWRWVRAHPMDALALFLKKLGWVFHAQHVALPHSYPFYAEHAPLLRVLFVGPWVLIPLGLVGLLAAMPAAGRSSYLIWLSFVPAYAMAVALFFVAERYRLPMLVPLCIGAGAALDAALRAGAAGRARSLLRPTAAVAAMLVLVNWPHGLHDGRLDEGVRMAERLVIVGRYDDAEAWVERLAPVVPDPGRLHFYVGRQYLAARELPRAIAHLTRAVERTPDRSEMQAALGQALLAAGRPADAVPHLRRGLEGGTATPGVGHDLAVALRDSGDRAGAADVLRDLSPGDDAEVDAWLQLGRLAADVQAPDVGERFFRRAAELRPDLPAARLQYGLNLLVQKKMADAARELTEAVRLDPRNPDALAQLAFAELALGRTDLARAHTAAALAIDPSHALARQLDAVLRRMDS
jgi:tetratricopeptide (TPR) repeat protein